MDDPIILFVDDDPLRAARMYEWQTEAERNRTIWVKNVKEALRVLKDYTSRIEQMHLDHDLDGQNPLPSNNCLAGMELVRFFENLPKGKLITYLGIRITLHDHNRYASLEQLKRLQRLGFKVKYIPFGLESEVR